MTAARKLLLSLAIVALAQTGVGCPYVWGGTCWDPADPTWKAAGCSGYVTKRWQGPSSSETTDRLPPYFTTETYYSGTTHWSALALAEEPSAFTAALTAGAPPAAPAVASPPPSRG